MLLFIIIAVCLYVCRFVTPQSNVKLIYKMHKGFKCIWTIKEWQQKKKTKKGQNTSVWFPIKVFIVTTTVVVVRFYGFNMSCVCMSTQAIRGISLYSVTKHLNRRRKTYYRDLRFRKNIRLPWVKCFLFTLFLCGATLYELHEKKVNYVRK